MVKNSDKTYGELMLEAALLKDLQSLGRLQKLLCLDLKISSKKPYKEIMTKELKENTTSIYGFKKSHMPIILFIFIRNAVVLVRVHIKVMTTIFGLSKTEDESNF